MDSELIVMDPINKSFSRVKAYRFRSFGPRSIHHCYQKECSRRLIGGCAIAVGTNGLHATTWNVLRGVLDSLDARCVSNPALKGHMGGTAISQPYGPHRLRDLSGEFINFLPLSSFSFAPKAMSLFARRFFKKN